MWSHYSVLSFCILFSCLELSRALAGNEHHSYNFSGAAEMDVHTFIKGLFNNSFPTKTPKNPDLNSEVVYSGQYVPSNQNRNVNTIISPSTGNRDDFYDMNITTSYYSTTSENYPTFAEMEPLLRKFQQYFVKDILPKPDLSTLGLMESDSYKYQHLCNNQVDIITPREIKNAEGQFVQLANFPEYEQAIRAETCVAVNGTCSFNENFPKHLKPICKQNYIFRELVTIVRGSNGEKTLRKEDIPIPSCCECYLFDTNM